ncbi:MAG: hypothetical protein APF82_09025 [Sphingomonadales bacterium BRH_c42]|nr:MAG: hypothetical protein APF82_09025 [Sphingomonadales bacterium BRH_c42]
MQPTRQLVGISRTPVLTVDEIGPEPAAIIAMAQALGPFPYAANNYPGLRRIIGPADNAAWTYVTSLLKDAASFIGGAFDVDGFDLVEASFSLVTTRPQALTPVQRLPHFDSVDEDLIALLHYAAPCAGTAFYRHIATGLELVTPDNVDRFVAIARRDAQSAGPRYVYPREHGAFEPIGHVEGRAGRLVAYPGRLLHSGVIPQGFDFSDDPASGRLTTNIFLKTRLNAGARA